MAGTWHFVTALGGSGTLFAQFGYAPGNGVIQALTDGSILLQPPDNHSATTSALFYGWRLVADQTGSYVNGSVVQGAQSVRTGTAGSHILRVDGTVLFGSVETGSRVGRFEVYDPVANSFTLLTSPAYTTGPGTDTDFDATLHGPMAMLADGRVLANYTAHGLLWRADNTLQHTDSDASFGGATTRPTGAGDEASMILLPDNTLLNQTVYNRNVAGNGVSTISNPPMTEIYHPSFYGSGGWCVPQPGPGETYQAHESFQTGYEVGAMVYSPLSGKAHLFGGNGKIYTYAPYPGALPDPTQVVATRWSVESERLPYFRPDVNYNQGSVPQLNAQHNGQTLTQLVSGTIRVDAHGMVSGPGGILTDIFVALQDGTEAKIHWTSKADTLVSGFPTYTDYSGCSLVLGSGTALVHTNDPVAVNTFAIGGQDAPAVVLPSGQVLFVAGAMLISLNSDLPLSSFGGNFNGLVWLWKYDPVGHTIVKIPWPTGWAPGTTPWLDDMMGSSGSGIKMTLLPTGEVLVNDSLHAAIYTPDPATDGTPMASAKPVITSAPASVKPGDTFNVAGTQLCGLTEGGYYGDDIQPKTNFPIARFTHVGTGRVVYARTLNHSSRSIKPSTASTTDVVVPADIAGGTHNFSIVANGIASDPVSLLVSVPHHLDISGGGSIVLVDQRHVHATLPTVSGAGNVTLTGHKVGRQHAGGFAGNYGDGTYGSDAYGGINSAGSQDSQGSVNAAGVVTMAGFVRRVNVTGGGSTAFASPTAYGSNTYGFGNYGTGASGKKVGRSTLTISAGGVFALVATSRLGVADILGGGHVTMVGYGIGSVRASTALVHGAGNVVMHGYNPTRVAYLNVFLDGIWQPKPLFWWDGSIWRSIPYSKFFYFNGLVWVQVYSDPIFAERDVVHGGGAVTMVGSRRARSALLVSAGGNGTWVGESVQYGVANVSGGGGDSMLGQFNRSYGFGNFGGGTYGRPDDFNATNATAGDTLTLVGSKRANATIVVTAAGGVGINGSQPNYATANYGDGTYSAP